MCIFAETENSFLMRQKLVVFTGAGISAESGIPTFRDANGMWGKYDAMKLASRMEKKGLILVVFDGFLYFCRQ